MQMPEMLDWFGWCTWDAFYTKVNPQGIKDGLMRFDLVLDSYIYIHTYIFKFLLFWSVHHSLSQGGTPAKFLLIDDGWQDTVNEFQKEGEPIVEGSQ